MDLGRVLAIGRWTLIGGLVATSLGFLLGTEAVVWAGVALALLGLAVNTAGKGWYYGRLSIPRGNRLLVFGAWLLLAATIGGLVVDYSYSRLATGYEGAFWPLVIAAAGFGAVYSGLRSRYVPTEPEGG